MLIGIDCDHSIISSGMPCLNESEIFWMVVSLEDMMDGKDSVAFDHCLMFIDTRVCVTSYIMHRHVTQKRKELKELKPHLDDFYLILF